VHDKDLYQQILGLRKPWVVERVEVNRGSQEVVVHVGLEGPIVLGCPECGKAMPGYDHRECAWRHLDTCQYRTILKAKVPRGTCAEHGVRSVRVPWAEKGSQFTALFEALAIDWLKEAAQSAVASILRISWIEVHGIMERAVARGLARRTQEDVHLLGVDEKAFCKGHEYVTVVCSLETGAVQYVGNDRKQGTLERYYDQLSPTQREEVYAIAMDMWAPYVEATRAKIEDADEKIVFDKFHIAQHMADAVDKVRRKENKALRDDGDDRLVGTRYAWLVSPENKTPEQRRTFAELKSSTLKTARAWALKETLRDLWTFTYKGAAKNFFGRWFGWATRSRLQPIKEAAQMIKRHLDQVLNYITYPITNAMSESVNAKIQWIKYTARGFRNRENFKRAILFHCGALELYPQRI
jgi:transposase